MAISRSNIGFELKNKEGNKTMAKSQNPTVEKLKAYFKNPKERDENRRRAAAVAEKNKGQKSTVGPGITQKRPNINPDTGKPYKIIKPRLAGKTSPVTKTPPVVKKQPTYQERKGSTVGTAGQTRAKKRVYGDTPKRKTEDRFPGSSEKTQDKSSKKIKDKPAKGKPPKPSVKPAAPSVADKKKIYSKVGANIKQHRGGKSTMGGRKDKVDSPLPKHLKAPLKTPAGKGLSSVGSKSQRRKPVTSATGFGEQMDLQRLKEVKRSKHREKDYPYLGERKKLTSNRNPFGGGMKDGGEVEAYFKEQTIPWEEKQKMKGKK